MKSPKPFDNGIDGTRRVLGWIYLPVHVFLLPFLLGMIAAVWPGATDGGLNALLEHVNLIYYAIGAVFVLLVFFPVLRSPLPSRRCCCSCWGRTSPTRTTRR